MGYYIDFVFDPNEKLNCDDIVQKFVKLGARRLPDGHIGLEPERYIHVEFPDFGYPIWVYRDETEHQRGNWADVRMSWMEDEESMPGRLDYILGVAEKLGCRVYDGQIKEYVSRHSVAAIASRFAKTAGMITGLIGKAQSGENPS